MGLQILQAIFPNSGSNIDLKEKQLTQMGLEEEETTLLKA